MSITVLLQIRSPHEFVFLFTIDGHSDRKALRQLRRALSSVQYAFQGLQTRQKIIVYNVKGTKRQSHEVLHCDCNEWSRVLVNLGTATIGISKPMRQC